MMHPVMNAVDGRQSTVNCFYTLLFFGGRQPLCGKGVISFIMEISRPDCDKALIAPSRPEPGPFTKTSQRFIPASNATFAASEAAIYAA